MAQIDLGKLKFTWKGSYADSTAYSIDDIVFDKGTAWVVTAGITTANTTDPEASSSFARMATGVNWRSNYNNSSAYYLNDVVLEANVVYIYKNTTSTTGNRPPNSTYWDVFLANTSGNTLVNPGDIIINDPSGTSTNLGVGTAGIYLKNVLKPNESFPTGQKVVYSVNTTGSNTAILTNQNGINVGAGSNSANASITLTRGRNYKFQMPIGTTYSFKDSNAGGYANNSAAGRIIPCPVGVGTSTISDGGTFNFYPSSDTVGFPTTGIKLRNEAGGTDEVSITLVDPTWGPKWVSSADNNEKEWVRQAKAPNLEKDDYWPMFNSKRCTETAGIGTEWFLPEWMQPWGFGPDCGQGGSGGYRSGGYVDSHGKVQVWGNMYQDGTNNWYGWHGQDTSDMTYQIYGRTNNPRFPLFFYRALAGDAAESKWLTDRYGNNLGYETVHDMRMIQAQRLHHGLMCLSDNGILFYSGYGAYGEYGLNDTTSRASMLPISFYDTDESTVLVGAARPKIKQFRTASAAGDHSTSYHMTIAIDTEGFVYTWGYNGYGQLGQGDTTQRNKAIRLPKSAFGGEDVIWVTTGSQRYNATYAITKSGKLWGCGYNAYGMLGDQSTTNRNSFIEMTGVSGSNILNKKVVYVSSVGGNSSHGKTWILTTEGKVYCCGKSQGNGINTGVYSTTADVNITNPVELTDAANTCNSGNQKVISVQTSGGRYPQIWLITDGGDSGQPKVYGVGRNDTGQQGTGRSTTHGVSGSSMGNWLPMAEIKFRTFPDFMDGTGDVNGTQYDSTLAGDLKIGRIVKITSRNQDARTDGPVMALDEYGQMFMTGEWNTYNPAQYTEKDNHIDFNATQDWTNYFMPCWNQPEKFLDIQFNNCSAVGENSYTAIGQSGRFWIGGYGGWGTMGTHANNASDSYISPGMV